MVVVVVGTSGNNLMGLFFSFWGGGGVFICFVLGSL
jgi:hypothetical protein